MSIEKQEVDALLKHFPQGIVALDLETTGLSPLMDKIIELSAIKVTPSGVETFDFLIDPQIEIPEVTIKIHGIKNDMVEGKPIIDEVLPKFFDFIGDLPLVAHNAKFDLGFIVFLTHDQKISLKNNNETYCSCQFSRYALKHLRKFNLAHLAGELNINLENHHRALDDAVAALRIFAKGLIYKEDASLKKAYQFSLGDFDIDKMKDIPEKLLPLQAKVEKQEIVQIKYKGGTMKNQFRPIRPISFLPMPAGNVLYAHCLTSNLFKSYALSKITDFKEVGEVEKGELAELSKK